jgi:hypothetical protein
LPGYTRRQSFAGPISRPSADTVPHVPAPGGSRRDIGRTSQGLPQEDALASLQRRQRLSGDTTTLPSACVQMFTEPTAAGESTGLQRQHPVQFPVQPASAVPPQGAPGPAPLRSAWSSMASMPVLPLAADSVNGPSCADSDAGHQ